MPRVGGGSRYRSSDFEDAEGKAQNSEISKETIAELAEAVGEALLKKGREEEEAKSLKRMRDLFLG